eukprot:5286799-Alexandrium_andersonii.AAC.1
MLQPPEGHYLGLATGQGKPDLVLPEQDDYERVGWRPRTLTTKAGEVDVVAAGELHPPTSN